MSDAPELAMPPLPATWLPFWKSARVIRRNTLSAWPADAFEMDVIKRRILMRDQVIVNSPDYIRHVMLDNVSNYGRSKVFARLVEPVVGKGLLLSEGDEWRQQRRAVAPAYTPARGAELAGVVRRHLDLMLDRWCQLEDGAVRNMTRDIADVTLGVGAEAIFSETNFKDLQALFDAVFEYDLHVRPTVGDLLGLPNWLSRPNFSTVSRLTHNVEAPVLRMIEERQKKGVKNDVFAAICSLRDNGQPPSAKSIRDQAMSLIMAGHLTTHATLLWTFYLLALHPAERRRIETEIDSVLSGRRPEYQDIAKLRLTWQAIQEAMRLYPPVHIIPRAAIGPDRLGDCDVPKGATIVISPWLTHRNPKLWDDPSRFIPDRFSQENSAARPRYAYLPFGAGQHICAGAHFAMLETVLIVASVIQSWRLDMPEGAKVEPVALVSLRPRDGMTMRFHRRRPGD